MNSKLKIQLDKILSSLFVVMACGFLFRLFLLRYQYAIFMDEAHYIRMGVAFSQGHWQDIFHGFWTPGYPFFVGIATFFFKHYELTARVLNILFGVLTLWPVYRLGVRLFGRQAGVLSCWFMALYPPAAYMDTSVLAEPSFIFWGVLGIWLGWQAIEHRKGSIFFLAGLSFGLSYLSKPEGFAFVAVYSGIVAVLIVFQIIREKKMTLLGKAALFFAGYILIASPYLLYLRHEGGTWMISGKGAAFQQWHSTFFTPEDDDVFHDLDENCTTFKNDAILHFGTFLRDMRSQGNYVPVDFVILLKKYITYLFRVLKEGIPTMLTLPGCALFILGMFGGKIPRKSITIFLYVLLFMGFYWFVVIPMFVVDNRYLASMLPLTALFWGQGMIILTDRIKSMMDFTPVLARHHGRLSIWLTAILVIASLFLPGLGQLSQHGPRATGEWEDAIEVKLAGEWIHENSTRQPPVIMTDNKAVDFYAGNYRMKTGASFPQDSTDRILKYGKKREVDYFVIVERYLHLHPVLQRWITGDVPPQLQLLKTIVGPSGQRAWIFGWKEDEDSSTDKKGL